MKNVQIPVLAALLCWVGCSPKIQTNPRHFILSEAPTVDLHQYRSVQLRPHQNPDFAIAMAISGGGSRAYNFAIGVLLGLEEIPAGNSNLLHEVDYFSTVSGGGFAAGSYIAARYEYDTYGGKESFKLQDYFVHTIKENLARSYSTPIAQSWFYPKNWFTYLDDGDALEKAIDLNVLGYRHRRQHYGRSHSRSIRLSDMFVNCYDTLTPVKLPMLVANGTIFPRMSIFPFVPNVIDTFQISGYTHLFRNNFQQGPIDPYSLPLSVGIKASGSFPAAISNTTLLSSWDSVFRYLHIVDGGIADNIGYQTAIEMLKQDTVATHKVLLVVDADGGGIPPTFSRRKAGYLGISVFSKLPSSGLDARHNLLRTELTERCRQNNITPVFLSFSNLIEGNAFIPPPEIDVIPERIKLISKLNLAPQLLSPSDLSILYELVTQIPTKYSIKPDEQELLYLTGKKVVLMQQETLREIIDMQNARKINGK
ncbi:MAG: patatin-like phospholipase family protein [Bacteroidia bacterium]